ncbi:hypothetical protein BDY17DRAFT_270648 [Neohortaea acidophila]|uniref:SPX domain-containing protein n=1 Tax=Neohortaea acidophila TaxID=245834 RepID=A0A6A6PIV9_9PEZI|nr:uncharacterized protein BDY17DRAFT_270648 [Neohortaea acidophila]KAF2479855.1 hypothetical protein BDY17DRAFT_270648 [Neohortaea acidophila]
MKYGDTLRQRSIPAWSHHNIDYDEIKHFIKDNTTPGKGKSISIPGKSDAKLLRFENDLFDILLEQHTRISLFVTSKAGEIRRRLDHAHSKFTRLSTHVTNTSDQGIPIGRLERYSKLENDLLKTGDEIKSLARFVATQRTAFRKLLKKYKKWTGSAELEARFHADVLASPNSFTHLDLGPLLDDYSDALQHIRSLYEARLQNPDSRACVSSLPQELEQTSANQLRTAYGTGSKVELDTAIAAVPFDEAGSLATYFVHPDSIVELRVLLLQHFEHHKAHIRSDSLTSSSPSRKTSNVNIAEPDSFMLVADQVERLAREQNAVTIDEREHLTGQRPQRAQAAIRWTTDEDAILTARHGRSKLETVPVQRKDVDMVFEPASMPAAEAEEVRSAKRRQSVAAIRSKVQERSGMRALYTISTCRSRFVGINSGPNGVLLATLDTNIVMQKAGHNDDTPTSTFPFAVLQIRQEGSSGTDLLSLLDHNHLVERVRGFSLEYHALWELFRPVGFAPPFWLPMLSEDIRKLPPPALTARGSSLAVGGSSGSATHRSNSTAEGTTAVETGRSSSAIPDQLETPPLRSFRKKRRRTYAESPPPTARQNVYWNEYDDPEDGGDGAYIIYIDPNAKSALDTFFEKLTAVFRRGGKTQTDNEHGSLLSPHVDDDDDLSSDDQTPPSTKYGTLSTSTNTHRSSQIPSHWTTQAPPAPAPAAAAFPRITAICLSASVAILIVAYILASTAKHKYATEVDAGVLFAVVCSLVFAVVGFMTVRSGGRDDGGEGIALGVAVVVLVLDVVCSSALLAWMVG